MRATTRIMLAAAALLLSLAYVAPLWHIGLEAPQYPEGIGMFVWIDTIDGQKPNDLHNINGLNHYIGMKAIVPDAIAELKLMPPIVAGLMVIGLLASIVGRRGLLYGWTLLFAVVALAGLVDFWYWGYDYGHDLDPTAAIKVPGLSYQPPLLGSKKLLNFTAHSWPGLGGWAIAVALLAGVALSVFEYRQSRARRGIADYGFRIADCARGARGLLLVVVASVATLACARPGPGVIRYDADACDRCRMTISDPAFAAQLVTRTGKVYRFDDPACLAAFVAAGQVAADDLHSLWANDHAHPGTPVDARDVVFVTSDRIRAPMNGGVAAFASRVDAAALQSSVGGELHTWADIVKRVNP